MKLRLDKAIYRSKLSSLLIAAFVALFCVQIVITPVSAAKSEKQKVDTFFKEYDPEKEYQSAPEAVISMPDGSPIEGEVEEGEWVFEEFDNEEFQKKEAKKTGKPVPKKLNWWEKTTQWAGEQYQKGKKWVEEQISPKKKVKAVPAKKTQTKTWWQKATSYVGNKANQVKNWVTQQAIPTVVKVIASPTVAVHDIYSSVINGIFKSPVQSLFKPTEPKEVKDLRENRPSVKEIKYSTDPELKKIQTTLHQVISSKPSHQNFAKYKNDILTLHENKSLSGEQIISMNKWITDYSKTNKNYFIVSDTERYFLNSTYIQNLKLLSVEDKITDIDVYIKGTEYISQYWDNSDWGKYKFIKDISLPFSLRYGTDCKWTTGTCMQSEEEINAFVASPVGGEGYNTIFDDSKHGRGNNAYHITGYVVFGFEKDTHCGPRVANTGNGYIHESYELKWPPIWCFSTEGLVMAHESDQYNNRKVENTDNGTSWEDLFSGLIGADLGKDLREGNIKVEDFSEEFEKRLGENSKYDVCQELLPKVPESIFWDKPTCDDVPDNLINSQVK